MRALPPVLVVCLLTFVHFVGAQMRGPVMPLYAAAHGATATAIGFIVAAHMAAAAAGSIPLGRAADRWGRRPLVLGGIGFGIVTSLLLPLVNQPLALTLVYGLAGFGVAAYTPSALALVGDTTTPGQAGRAYAWHSTAHYGAIAIGPFVGALAAEAWGYRGAFVGSAAVIALALGVALSVALPRRPIARDTGEGLGERGEGLGEGGEGLGERLLGFSHEVVWAGWIAGLSGMVLQGVTFTFLPLLALERSLTPAAIGVIFLALGLANTLARVPAGWLIDRTARSSSCAVNGLLLASAITALVPHTGSFTGLVVLAAAFGGLSGVAFVGVTAALAAAATPTTRGLVMGGYSTALYLGLAVGAFTLGPVITHAGYGMGFAVGGAAGAIGVLIAAVLWATGYRRDGRAGEDASIGRNARALADSSRPSP